MCENFEDDIHVQRLFIKVFRLQRKTFQLLYLFNLVNHADLSCKINVAYSKRKHLTEADDNKMKVDS